MAQTLYLNNILIIKQIILIYYYVEALLNCSMPIII